MKRTNGLRMLSVGAMLTVTAVASAGIARAESGEAMTLLKGMSDFVSGQKVISASFDASIEVVTPELEKIQFNNSGEVLLARPDKLRASRTGGYADVELTYDGKTATVLAKGLNSYAQLELAGTTDSLFDRLRSDFGMQIPGADLLASDAFDVLKADVVQATYIGPAIIGGVECDHLAFRNDETDWQLWVQKGPQAIPRKLVITTKAVTGAPQYTLVIRDWKTDAAPAANAFEFVAPNGAENVKLENLTDIDELPAGVVKGAAK
jgi:hypothetical protein